ncbi:MAG TPA: hypothetical protein DGG94_06945 [Micromonosporaceae bacterium]|nr:hypothetical protein [Micromonosporaceae bacterium]HCU49524.1 hypothetical protein [Micromonosporaceae bacterium]
MTKIGLDFHATRKEIATVVAEAVHELGLWMAYERNTLDDKPELIAQGDITGALEIPGDVSSLVLSVYPLNMIAEAPFGLAGHNRDSLSIRIGEETGDHLGESNVGAMTDDADSLRIWRKFRKKLVASMRNDGISVVNTMSGASAQVRDHYYSEGAKQLYASGKRLAGLGEFLSYKLE